MNKPGFLVEQFIPECVILNKLNNSSTVHQQKDLDRFSTLRTLVEQKRVENINHRIAVNPYPTARESLLGAFMEMFEPHLLPIIHVLMNKGYRVEPSSGFCGEHFNCQTLNGAFPIDYILVNHLTKVGYKTQLEQNTRSIKFWPDTADLPAITEKYQKIVKILPQRHQPLEPSQSLAAKKFRRVYVPKNMKLKKQRLFEILMYNVLHTMEVAIKKRLTEKPKPNEMEYKMGVFIEMIEPQVRAAIIMLNKKGYTTDASGFMNQAETQMIDGDFTVEKSDIIKLQNEGVIVETNNSGYTRLQFYPLEANKKAITDKWLRIVSMLPDRRKSADPSMTVRARQFRSTYN